jgi:signal transduction histidine kinase
MALKSWFQKYGLYGVVALIGLLLLANVFLMYRNHQVIEENKLQQEQAEQVKVKTLDILRNLHFFDMVMRSYALVQKDRFYVSVDSAFKDKDKMFDVMEKSLQAQGYPLQEFYTMKDSINKYFIETEHFRKELVKDDKEGFIKYLDQDPGYPVWLAFSKFSTNVNAFENRIAAAAKFKYEGALQFSYVLQFILFLITLPTLAYTAFYTLKALSLSEELRQTQEERNWILSSQNEALEQRVRERTNEILAQNEEITAHNEQLRLQQDEIEVQQNALEASNRELRLTKQIVEEQNTFIKLKNDELTLEVNKQTDDLKETNHALIEQNSRLQQFAYIISHNLRAPLARLVGLAGIFNHAYNKDEEAEIIKMMVSSAENIDEVIRDLAYILEIQKQNTQVLMEIDLNDTIDKVVNMLGQEVTVTRTSIMKNVPSGTRLRALPQYLESIFYNLISNAIKYRDTKRRAEVIIRAVPDDNYTVIEVSDNGLGIDLEKYNDKLFLIYKRFHSHVEGRGLGLYLVKTQVAALGGRIAVKSKVGDGTTFTLYFK